MSFWFVSDTDYTAYFLMSPALMHARTHTCTHHTHTHTHWISPYTNSEQTNKTPPPHTRAKYWPYSNYTRGKPLIRWGVASAPHHRVFVYCPCCSHVGKPSWPWISLLVPSIRWNATWKVELKSRTTLSHNLTHAKGPHPRGKWQ